MLLVFGVIINSDGEIIVYGGSLWCIPLNNLLSMIHACRILTWEDGYYDNPDEHDSLENKPKQKALEQVDGVQFSHDALGLAVAKMSYRVYTLGEGYDSSTCMMLFNIKFSFYEALT